MATGLQGPSHEAGAGFGRALVLAAAVAAAIKLWLAWTTYGTNDVQSFQSFLHWHRTQGLVEVYTRHGMVYFNHPPFVLHLLGGIGWLSGATGWPFAFCLKLPAILADAGSVWVVYRILAPRLGERAVRIGLCLMALAPTSILVSGFHGNTDPVMVFFLLVALASLDRPGGAWLAGAALGMSLNVKVVPLLFCPLIALHLPTSRRRIECFGAAAVVVVLGSMPYLLQEPARIARSVLGYGSYYGHWGLGRLLEQLPPAFAAVNTGFRDYGKYVLLALVIAASFWLQRRARAQSGESAEPAVRLARRSSVFDSAGVLAFLVLAATPGFGVQYLVWLVPWIALIGPFTGAFHCVASGAFLVAVYTFWNGGFPWHFANSFKTGFWRGETIAFEILCWISVLAGLLVQIRNWRQASNLRSPRT